MDSTKLAYLAPKLARYDKSFLKNCYITKEP